MEGQEFSRYDALETLVGIKCRHDSKYGISDLDRLVWIELINKYPGILSDVEGTYYEDDLPEVFQVFLNTLDW